MAEEFLPKSSNTKAQIVKAPSRDYPMYSTSILLAGTTANTDSLDWRTVLSTELSDLPITIYNPFRPDWGKDWKDLSCQPYREQIEWELDMLERADVVLVYLHPVTDAPISMMELGLCARSGKAVVCVPEGFRSRPNVQVVCERFGIEIVNSAEGFREVLLRKLNLTSQKWDEILE